MTHDKLLIKLLVMNANESEQTRLSKTTQALRVIVEMHKPIEEDGKLWCKHEVCYNHIEFLERDDCDCSYPCPTIKAIEKELM